MNASSKREAISYGRFSSKKQELGDSTDRQRASYERVCTRYSDRCTPSARYDFGHFFGRGESGFSAEHLADGGSLCALLSALESGEIEASKTVVVIEAFDRLGRLEPDLATGLLSKIVRSGCALAVDRPDCWIGSVADLNGPQWMLFQSMLVIANQESKQKSERKLSSWAGKRSRADEKPMTTMLPGWCAMVRGAIVERPDRGEVVRRIFTLAASGLRGRAITGVLNKEKVPAFGRKASWQTGYVKDLLTDRRVLGELRPCVRVGKLRKETGQVVVGYFPATVDPELWYRVQAELQGTARKTVGRPSKHVNLFTGLFRDQDTRDSFNTVNKGKYRYLVSASALNGKTDFIAVPVPELEDAFFSILRELKPSDMADRKPNENAAKLKAAEGELEETKQTIADTKARLLRKSSAVLLDLLEAAEEQRGQLERRVEELQAAATVREDDVLTQTQTLVDMVRSGDDEFRQRLKSKLCQLIDVVWVRITSDGGYQRTVWGNMLFRSGWTRAFRMDMRRTGRGGRRMTVETHSVAGTAHV